MNKIALLKNARVDVWIAQLAIIALVMSQKNLSHYF